MERFSGDTARERYDVAAVDGAACRLSEDGSAKDGSGEVRAWRQEV